MKQIDKVYVSVTNRMRSELPELGFVSFREDLEGPFGSKVLEFRHDLQAIRFIWDGRESWFLLEYCADLGAKPYPKWKDIRLERLEFREPNEEESEVLVSVFCKSIINFANEYRAA